MRNLIPKPAFLMVPLFGLCALAHGQDIPAVTSAPTYQGFVLPEAPGTLSYSLNASESARIGYYNGGNSYATSLSANLGYTSTNLSQPFSAIYAGGYTYSTATSSSRTSTIFQSLSLTQGFQLGRWRGTLSDSIRFLPNAPAGGYSGIPGIGDPANLPGDPNQDIYTSGVSTRISNAANISVQRQLSASMSANGSGSYNIQRFVGSSSNVGYGTDGLTGSGGLSRRLDALSSVNLSYNYSNFSYTNTALPFSFTTQGLSAGYTRRISRQLSGSVSGGPQRTSSSTTGQEPKISFSGNAGLSYAARDASISVNASRAVRSGSGLVQGAITTSFTASYGRTISRVSHLSVNGSYFQNDSISTLTTNPFATKSLSVSAQGSRSIGRYMSAHLSYSLIKQLVSGSATRTNAFNGVSQIISFGISYSPRPIQLGHQ